jgi:tRNA(Ile)-lysidine synthase
LTRSHPPALLTLTRRTVLDEQLWVKGDRILVAVSGGPDSMALLHVLAALRGKLGHELIAHGVDHGLREEASRELDLARAFADKLEVPFARTVVSLPRGGNLQARARAVRMKALRAAAAELGATRIATAHHADDRAETVLLRLLRGAGPIGLAVLPPQNHDLVRPFIRASRRDIEPHLERHAVPFAHDPSNLDPRFLRARVRHELLPLLLELSPGLVGHLNALADRLQIKRPPGPDVGAYMASLPRATRLALDALVVSGSPTTRVRLPHGLVVSFEPDPSTNVPRVRRLPRETPKMPRKAP